MVWKTIEKDGYPKIGSTCLCHIRHKLDSWCDYHVYKFTRHFPLPHGCFFLYDLMISDKDILEYMVIEEDKK